MALRNKLDPKPVPRKKRGINGPQPLPSTAYPPGTAAVPDEDTGISIRRVLSYDKPLRPKKKAKRVTAAERAAIQAAEANTRREEQIEAMAEQIRALRNTII